MGPVKFGTAIFPNAVHPFASVTTTEYPTDPIPFAFAPVPPAGDHAY